MSNPFDDSPTNPFDDVPPQPQHSANSRDDLVMNRPPSIANRHKTTGGIPTQAGKNLLNRFKKNRNSNSNSNSNLLSSDHTGHNGDDHDGDFNDDDLEGDEPKSKYQIWPFDDYHKAQERYYEKLDAQAEQAALAEEESKQNNTNAAAAMNNDPYYMERPPDLPDIHQAVQDLNLVDFEQKAEERAIALVSQWLYDTGLIDELLENGGFKASTAAASAPDHQSVMTEPSQEGVEIGVTTGIPIEGPQKMDKEIDTKRASTGRELAIINTRLNDGVAASGAEVQELVNAVTATKGELGRLRELSTYISNGGDLERRTNFMLQHYPHLKNVSNARRNLQRCLRDLEFFSEIPSTCERLRDELHRCEWTETEWTTIRNVSMEHVELEILLIEAEAGMKARLNGQFIDDSGSGGIPDRGLTRRISQQAGMFDSTGQSLEHIDRFLAPHVKNVWELGDEIRERLLGGVESAFDLAMHNPAGMVALVESVEVYERASEEYEAHSKTHAGVTSSSTSTSADLQGLHFTDMRSAALAQIFKMFELRCLTVFRHMQEMAANQATAASPPPPADDDDDDDDDDENHGQRDDDGLSIKLNATLRAATELISEVQAIKGQIEPCFPPYWGIAAVWATSVAKVCLTHILQQIGNEEATKLPNFTLAQLLDLMACIEYFKEAVEETFDDGTIDLTNSHLNPQEEKKYDHVSNIADLFASNKKQVDVDIARDVVIWAYHKLWKVHSSADAEYLNRTQLETKEWVERVYSSEHHKTQTMEGRLHTSLPEDVFILAGGQLRTIQERLSRGSETVVQTSAVMFVQLRVQQISERDRFLEDLETCCAAANDFNRMSEKTEELIEEITDNADFSQETLDFLHQVSEDLNQLYNKDAVYAAGKIHLYIFEPIREAIGDELFSSAWEKEYTHNDLALTIVRTLEDFMGDLENFIDSILLRKAVDALIQASINFYIERLLIKADEHSGKYSIWDDNATALERMAGDIRTIREYFESLAESMPALSRVIDREFETLNTIRELMEIASGLSASDASDFVFVLQKRICDVHITTNVVGDLYHLVNPQEEKAIVEKVEEMSEVLAAVAPQLDEPDQHTVPGLRLDEMIGKLYTTSKRKRPGQSIVEHIGNRWKQSD